MILARYGMVIDLHKCAGCGACAITCKNENNVDQGIFWSHHIKQTTGTFPNVNYEYIPTLCNHCDNAACVKACPTTAMHKDENRLTLHDPEKCIGCKSCMQACPYGVISYNSREPHAKWRDDTSIIANGTSSGKEVAEKTGEPLPYYNPDRATTYQGVRVKGIVEKCTFCDHRLKVGEKPYCVESCPAGARYIGDLDDPNSEVSILLAKYGHTVLLPEKGTQPKVFYIRQF
ncbi:4Fe-4S dicluster domain-containing protein [Brevibacillus sp. SYSU BS000544]|uniref:4Fe-4S dicluster domain-containing protein n=1 Tax=Brevibacillus sp. SYSU BS000544 TaxID=3416443 RepID=UPI003CE52D68